MEQRPLRLGDTVDDYCPRERRITNHAILVVAGEEIQQTRCTACEAEHPYKHGKAPLKKKKDENGALYDEVLAGVLKPKQTAPEPVELVEVGAAVASNVVAAPTQQPAAPVPDAVAAHVSETINEVAVAEPEPEPVAASWGHRPLIRAQLPRIEGQAPVIPRQGPDFTIRQQGQPGYGSAHRTNGSRRGQGSGQNHHQGHGNGGGQSRGGRDQGGRSQGGRSRSSR